MNKTRILFEQSLSSVYRIRHFKTVAGIYYLQAAAALCIKTGGLMDPDAVPGLAHYLEHSKLTYSYHSCFLVVLVD